VLKVTGLARYLGVEACPAQCDLLGILGQLRTRDRPRGMAYRMGRTHMKYLRYRFSPRANLAFLLCVYCLAPIVFFSWHLYSLPGAPWPVINSDIAIHPLMAYHLTQWDFYYWGQDRLGSVIPFLAAVPVKVFGMDAVDVVAWVVYVLLLIGWAGIALLLQNPFLAWVLGVFLLTPPAHFAWLVLVGQPYSGQLFFFGLMAAALTRWPARWVAPTLVALAGGSIWASDFSLVILVVISTTMVLMKADLSPFLRLPSLIAAASVFVFLGVAKLTAHFNFRLLGKDPGMYGYGAYLFALTSLDGFLFNLRQFASQLGGLFLSPPYALLILSGSIAAGRLAILPPSFPKRCSQVALLCWVTSCLAAAGSHYVELNGGSIRYLSIANVFFVLSVLLAISGEVKRGWKTAQYFLLTVSVALHLASLIPYAQGFPSARESLRPLLTSGCSAYIGDYWTSYLIAGMFPDRFLATPHEGWQVRSWRMRDMVLAQRDICLIKEGWLEEFPDEMKQFGHLLTKMGIPEQYGKFTVCRYIQLPSS
jgi:hypothetical protein